LIARVVKEYDYELLHRFVLSVLWRASVSSQKFFKGVDLGIHQESIKASAFGDSNASSYPFFVGKLIYSTTDNLMLAPFRRKFEGVNYWCVYIGDFHFFIKVDSGRAIPASILDVHAKPNSALLIVCRDLIGSPEHLSAIESTRLRKVGR
jgi:hypothetical protein